MKPDACKKRYQDPYFYLFTVLRQSSIPPFSSLDVSTSAAAPTTLLLDRYTWKSRLAVVDFD